MPSLGPGPRLSKAQFIEKADSLCQVAYRRVRAVNARVMSGVRPGTPQALSLLPKLIRADLAIVEPLTADLKALTAPAADIGTLKLYLATLDQGSSLQREGLQLTARADAAELTEVSRKVAAVHVREQRLARTYGFHACSRS